MTTTSFRAVVLKDAVNRFVRVPLRISRAFEPFMNHGRVRVAGTIEGHPLYATLVPVHDGTHRLYVTGGMRAATGVDVSRYTLTRLGVDHIDIYRPGRLDPAVPIEETIGAVVDLVKAEYVRAIGLSEVGPETIRRAHPVHPISDLQIEYSLISRRPESTVFPLLSQLGIGVAAYGPVTRPPQRLTADITGRLSCPSAAVCR
jgi:hypothetical protein